MASTGTTTEAPLSIQEQKRKIIYKAKILIRRADIVLKNAVKDLEDAKEILEPAGLSVDSSILDPMFAINGDIAVLRTTGGYSNTDHVVNITGDVRKDRIEELKRSYQRRVRSSQPEFKGLDRWDKPKIPGERRRRIFREKDLPQAPPEPPQTGYVIFVFQMTTKIRNDRPNEPHRQTEVVKEISKIWKLGMEECDRVYYNEFAREARDEYNQLLQEYRATGRYQQSRKFEKLQGVGPWVRVAWHEKNGLERELSTYETVLFPPRPQSLDAAYFDRRKESVKKRKLKNAESRNCSTTEEEEVAGETSAGEEGGGDTDAVLEEHDNVDTEQPSASFDDNVDTEQPSASFDDNDVDAEQQPSASSVADNIDAEQPSTSCVEDIVADNVAFEQPSTLFVEDVVADNVAFHQPSTRFVDDNVVFHQPSTTFGEDNVTFEQPSTLFVEEELGFEQPSNLFVNNNESEDDDEQTAEIVEL